jgi:hypothetical protein
MFDGVCVNWCCVVLVQDSSNQWAHQRCLHVCVWACALMHADRMGMYKYVKIGEGLLYSMVEFTFIKCCEKLYRYILTKFFFGCCRNWKEGYSQVKWTVTHFSICVVRPAYPVTLLWCCTMVMVDITRDMRFRVSQEITSLPTQSMSYHSTSRNTSNLTYPMMNFKFISSFCVNIMSYPLQMTLTGCKILIRFAAGNYCIFF